MFCWNLCMINFSVPQPVPVSSKSGQKQSHSPILKAQLSAPPRSGATSPPFKRPPHCALSEPKSISSPVPHSIPQSSSPTKQVSPTTSGSSTLIKSLLANKVQQRNLQRHVVPQGVSKMIIYSPEKLNSHSQGIIGSSHRIVRCIRPPLPGMNMNIRTPILGRPPMQDRIFPNQGRIVTSATPGVIKSSPIMTTKIQPKMSKQNMLSSNVSTARLNGVQRDVQMEVCFPFSFLKGIFKGVKKAYNLIFNFGQYLYIAHKS